MKHSSESGNIILIILVAIVLFAAITFVFTSNNRGAISTMGTAQAEASALQIMSYSIAVKQAYKRIRLQGYDSTEVDLHEPLSKHYGSTPGNTNQTNGNCNEDACKVFNTKGGAVTPKIFEEFTNGNRGSGSNSSGRAEYGNVQFARTEIVNSGTTNHDVVMYIPGLNSAICDYINKQANISANPTAAFGAWGRKDYYLLTGYVAANINATEMLDSDFGCLNITYWPNTYFKILERR